VDFDSPPPSPTSSPSGFTPYRPSRRAIHARGWNAPSTSLVGLFGRRFEFKFAKASLCLPLPPPTLIGVLQRLRNTDNANRNRTGPTGNNCRSSTRFPLPLGEEISVRRRHARFSFARSRACPIKGMLIKIHVGALGGEKRSIKSHRLIN